VPGTQIARKETFRQLAPVSDIDHDVTRRSKRIMRADQLPALNGDRHFALGNAGSVACGRLQKDEAEAVVRGMAEYGADQAVWIAQGFSGFRFET
jgi:hypothetical protein